MLPCWPADERGPVGGGQAEGTDERGQLMPNTNTFFYGLGWLESADAWMAMRKLRNQMVHEYVEDPTVLCDAMETAHGYVATGD